MVRVVFFIAVLAIGLFAQEDTTLVRIYPTPEGMTASDDPGFKPLIGVTPKATKARIQSDYLRLAGYHWLASIGLGAAGAGLIWASDDIAYDLMAGAMLVGSFAFHVAVPIDLILAGSAKP